MLFVMNGRSFVVVFIWHDVIQFPHECYDIGVKSTGAECSVLLCLFTILFVTLVLCFIVLVNCLLDAFVIRLGEAAVMILLGI